MIFETIEKQKSNILHTYEDLHELAEPSWQEEKTSHYLQEKLINAGLHVERYEGHFGFIAEIKGQSKEVIALRADMDALVQEVDGVVCANHSCGHDAHSTMVLHTALALVQSKQAFQHTIRFLFQPAEEKAAGALRMIEDGALENVKFLGGIHLRPSLELPFGAAAPAILHGSTTSLTGVIKGRPAHAARPEEGNNPIEAAALLIQELRQIELNASCSIKITELHGGEASNLIPETTRFTFDLRSRTNDVMNELIEKAQKIVQQVAATTKTEIITNLEDYSPAATKHPEAIKLAEKAILQVLGEVEPPCVSPGAEDFHFYTLKQKELVATMIGLGCDLKPGLHHPHMTFKKDALIYGTKILTQLLLEADKKQW
ncbi:amidohydrolase [Metabacillus iocasae]|uniref:Amidohydrolase n=1 Tax=Priestia iocasae TaxID=2291674 RepID=A0ABS2QYA8_9BACI|nr:amidohydrolase [Metabacillus iocasae]